MNRVEALKAGWWSHRRVLQNVLEMVPADQVKFAPWEGALSLGALAIHAADDFFYRFVHTGVPERFAPVEWSTMDDVKRIVQDRTDNTNSIFAALTDADLEKILEMPQMGIKGPGAMYLTIAKEHEIHHKGQLFVYARMVGVQEPPFFIARG